MFAGMMYRTSQPCSSHLSSGRSSKNHVCSRQLVTLHLTSLSYVSRIAAENASLWPSQIASCSSRCSVVAAASKKSTGSAASKGFGNPTKSPPSKAASRASQKCPCGSGTQYQSCCGRYHAGALAPTPEALLRARFSAYSMGIIDYLVATTHKENPEHTGDPASYARSLKKVARATEYISLNVIGQPEVETANSSSSSTEPANSSSSDADEDAFLRFSVQWKGKGEAGAPNVATETSHFKKVNGAWLYYTAVE